MIKATEYITKDMQNLKAKQKVNKCIDEVIENGSGTVEVRVANQLVKSILKTEITETKTADKLSDK